MTKYIYALNLEQNRYFVGLSADVLSSFYEHVNNRGPLWTQLYKPLGIIKVYESTRSTDLNEEVRNLMYKYSIAQVRGGAYTEVELRDEMSLLREIWIANSHCANCGVKGHYGEDCVSMAYNKEKEWSCRICYSEFSDKFSCESHELVCDKSSLRVIPVSNYEVNLQNLVPLNRNLLD